MLISSFWKISISSLACLMLIGCGRGYDGPPRAAVKGTVKLNGEPLANGQISFVPAGESEGPKATFPILDGKFDSPERFGPIVGVHRIEIYSTDTAGVAADDEEAIDRLKATPRKERPKVVRIPETYNRKSQISKKVSAEGPNEYEFELATKR